MLKLGIDLKLPIEWIQMFRTLLSIYLSWLILLSPRKPLLKDNVINKLLFVGILFVFAQSDMVSCILLMMIYFLSFQPILPMMNEYFFENRPIADIIDENLRRSQAQGYGEPVPTPIVYNFYDGIIKKDLLKI